MTHYIIISEEEDNLSKLEFENLKLLSNFNKKCKKYENEIEFKKCYPNYK